MQLKLVHYRDSELGASWKSHFANTVDVSIEEGNICRIEADAVVSPANSFGFMDGGLDHALSVRFGWGLQRRLQKAIQSRPMKELLVGEAIVFPTSDVTVPWLIVAPTMRVPMRLHESVNPYLAMKALLLAALNHAESPPIRSIAVPGLGTGVGAISSRVAALQMWTAYQEVILGDLSYPADFAAAQPKHKSLYADGIPNWG